MRERLAPLFALARETAAASRRHRLGAEARSVAFSLFLAIPATLVVVVATFTLVADPATVDGLIAQLRTVLPAEVTSLLRQTIERSAESPSRGVVASVVSGGLAIWTVVGAAGAVLDAADVAHGRPSPRGFLRARAEAAAVVLVLTAGASLIVAGVVVGARLEREAEGITGDGAAASVVWDSARFLFVLAAAFFSMRFVLNIRRDARARTVLGPTVATAGWIGSSWAFAQYVSMSSSYDEAWGAFSVVIVTLVWLWLTSAAMLVGAQADAALARLRDRSCGFHHRALRERESCAKWPGRDSRPSLRSGDPSGDDRRRT